MQQTRKISELRLLSKEVRRRMFATILNAGSGHLGGSSSSVELMVSLYFGGIIQFDPSNPRHPHRDRVLVRGHLGPLRYSIFSLLGWIPEEELATYRSFGSRLQGHESMDLVPGVDITPSGSLGMVLSYGVGCAVVLNNRGIRASAYVFLGDGEEQEGNISEAARHASHLRLQNLICVIDRNRKQLSRPTSGMDSGVDIRLIWEGYGWDVREIRDGHSIPEILNVFSMSHHPEKPTLIIANTVKGYGLRGASEHFSGYHTLSTFSKEGVAEAITKLSEEISNDETAIGTTVARARDSRVQQLPGLPILSSCQQNLLEVDTSPDVSEHYDDVLAAYIRKLVDLFRERSDYQLYVMTADWNNETVVRECNLDKGWIHYIDVGIREQHMLAMAHGISVTDSVARILIIDGDGFALRASDQLNAIAQAGSKLVIVGTDSGICEARNGPTHQSTGQPGMLTSMPGLLLLEPADAVDLYNCLNWALGEYRGPTYIRLHSTTVARLPSEGRNLRAYTAYQSESPCQLILVGAGLLLDGMVVTARKLDKAGVGTRVINVIDMEHLDRSFVDLLENGVPVLTAYNGNPLVLQSAVARAVMEYPSRFPSTVQGHGFTLGTTGKLEDLLKHFQMDAEGIEEVVREKFPNLFP